MMHFSPEILVFLIILFDAAKRTKNGSTILTRSAYRLRLNGT